VNTPLARVIIASLLLTPTVIHAQGLGGAFGGWATTGARPENEVAKGFRLSVALDRPWLGEARWRVEGAFMQAGFTRDFPLRPNQHVTENSIELAVHVMSRPLGGSSFRAFVGPVVSVGIGCGTDGFNDSNGRVACDGDGGDGTTRVGAVLGVHGEWGRANQFTLDLQGQANTVAAARGKGAVIAATLGLRLPR